MMDKKKPVKKGKQLAASKLGKKVQTLRMALRRPGS